MFGGYGYFSMTNSDTTSAADFRAVQSFSPDLTSELERLFINEPRTTAPAPTTPYTWTVPVRSRHGSSSDSGIRWGVCLKKLYVKILQSCYSTEGTMNWDVHFYRRGIYWVVLVRLKITRKKLTSTESEDDHTCFVEPQSTVIIM